MDVLVLSFAFAFSFSSRPQDTGAIVGGVVGGVVGLALLAALLFFCLRKRRTNDDFDEMMVGALLKGYAKDKRMLTLVPLAVSIPRPVRPITRQSSRRTRFRRH
jgi:hypothetical protein